MREPEFFETMSEATRAVDLPVALTPAIGRAAVADVKRPPAANLVACAGRAIAGMRVIPPSGGSRRRECRVEDKERGGEGRDQNEMHFAHRIASF